MERIEGAGKFTYHYPRLLTLVTSSYEGKDNVMTAAWHSPISLSPPIMGVAISPKRYTLELIKSSGEFGMNFLPFEMSVIFAQVGGISGREVDKFKNFGLEKLEPFKTKVPIIKGAYLAYELKLIDTKTYGDHEWVVGEILATHIDERFFNPSGIFELRTANPSLYLGNELYITASKSPVRLLDRGFYGRR
ncbi:MAG: flavin reductase [Thermoplasmata archaeon]|nr:MAG: flavin reductase [Thermoplasmata archaeon]